MGSPGYSYDTQNRLTGIRHADGTESKHAYDPFGRLIEQERPTWLNERKVKGEVSRYTYLGRHVLSEWKHTGAPLAENYIGNGQVVDRRMFGYDGRREPYEMLRTKGNHLYMLRDAQGSVAGLMNQHGELINKYRQDAFGNITSGILDPYNTHLLTSKSYDTGSGLYYFGSRWYDPSNATFLSQDSYRGSTSDPFSLHRFAYVNNNPATFVDVWGYAAQHTPQPTNIGLQALAGLNSFSATFFDRVGARIGGMASGFTNTVGGIVNFVKERPLESLGIAAAAVAAATVVVMTAPVSLPVILTTAQSMATNYLVSQAIGLGTGIAADAAYAVNPQLGEAVEWVHRGVQVWNAATNVMDGVSSLASVDPAQVMSLFSTEGAAALASVTGGLDTIASAAGLHVPGLREASEYLGYAGMIASASGLSSSIARRNDQLLADATTQHPTAGGLAQAIAKQSAGKAKWATPEELAALDSQAGDGPMLAINHAKGSADGGTGGVYSGGSLFGRGGGSFGGNTSASMGGTVGRGPVRMSNGGAKPPQAGTSSTRYSQGKGLKSPQLKGVDIRIPSDRGGKLGKHLEDFGVTPDMLKAMPKSHRDALIRNLGEYAKDIAKRPDVVAPGRFGGKDVNFYIRGQDVVVSTKDNVFISIWGGARNHPAVQEAVKAKMRKP